MKPLMNNEDIYFIPTEVVRRPMQDDKVLIDHYFLIRWNEGVVFDRVGTGLTVRASSYPELSLDKMAESLGDDYGVLYISPAFVPERI